MVEGGVVTAVVTGGRGGGGPAVGVGGALDPVDVVVRLVSDDSDK